MDLVIVDLVEPHLVVVAQPLHRQPAGRHAIPIYIVMLGVDPVLVDLIGAHLVVVEQSLHPCTVSPPVATSYPFAILPHVKPIRSRASNKSKEECLRTSCLGVTFIRNARSSITCICFPQVVLA